MSYFTYSLFNIGRNIYFQVLDQEKDIHICSLKSKRWLSHLDCVDYKLINYKVEVGIPLNEHCSAEKKFTHKYDTISLFINGPDHKNDNCPLFISVEDEGKAMLVIGALHKCICDLLLSLGLGIIHHEVDNKLISTIHYIKKI